MNFERFIINGPLTLFRANINGELSNNAWQAINEDKQAGRRLRTLVSVPADHAFTSLKVARGFGAQLLIDGEIINPMDFEQYRIERARNVRTMDHAVEALPAIAKKFADLVPFKMDAPVAKQQIRDLMPERQITIDKTLKVRIPANVTGHSGDRDRFAHGHHAGVSFVL